MEPQEQAWVHWTQILENCHLSESLNFFTKAGQAGEAISTPPWVQVRWYLKTEP